MVKVLSYRCSPSKKDSHQRMKQTEQEIRLFQGTVSAILGETSEEEVSICQLWLEWVYNYAPHMASKQNWVDSILLLWKHRHLDAIFSEENTSAANLSTRLHYHTKFIFIWFVLRWFCIEVWVRIRVVDFNDKNVDEASNHSTNQRAHYRNPPEVISSSENKQEVSDTPLGSSSLYY